MEDPSIEVVPLPRRNIDHGAGGRRISRNSSTSSFLIGARDGGLFRRDDARRGETYAAILRRLGRESIEAEATSGMPYETMKYSMHSYGMQFCEMRVARWLGSFDCGRILNEKTATSQFRGGIIMGIGEIGITGVSAAIANAVFNATGKRNRELPITLDKLL